MPRLVLLRYDSLRQGIKVCVGLVEQMCNTCILGSIDKLHVRLFIIRFQCLQTLLRDPLYPFLFFFLRMGMEILKGTTESNHFVLRCVVYSNDLSAVITDNSKLLDMFVFCAPFAVNTLYSLLNTFLNKSVVFV
jgi:hypothetical protein